MLQTCHYSVMGGRQKSYHGRDPKQHTSAPIIKTIGLKDSISLVKDSRQRPELYDFLK